MCNEHLPFYEIFQDERGSDVSQLFNEFQDCQIAIPTAEQGNSHSRNQSTGGLLQPKLFRRGLPSRSRHDAAHLPQTIFALTVFLVPMGSVRIGRISFCDADAVVCKGVVHAGDFYLRHVTTYAIHFAHAAGECVVALVLAPA